MQLFTYTFGWWEKVGKNSQCHSKYTILWWIFLPSVGKQVLWSNPDMLRQALTQVNNTNTLTVFVDQQMFFSLCHTEKTSHCSVRVPLVSSFPLQTVTGTALSQTRSDLNNPVYMRGKWSNVIHSLRWFKATTTAHFNTCNTLAQWRHVHDMICTRMGNGIKLWLIFSFSIWTIYSN